MDKRKDKPAAFLVRVSSEQHAKLKAAADAELLTLSAWARRVLLKAASKPSKSE